MKAKAIRLTEEESEKVGEALVFRAIELLQRIYTSKKIMDRQGWTETGREFVDGLEKEKKEIDRLSKVFLKD